jgi:hypothetical protein
MGLGKAVVAKKAVGNRRDRKEERKEGDKGPEKTETKK